MVGNNLFLKITAGCLTLALIGGVSALISSADTLSEYEKKQKELDKKAQEYQSVIEKTASDIAQKEEYKKALIEKITVLNEQIVSGREEISDLNTEITQMQGEIDTSKSKIAGRIDMLKQRVKVIYMSGETTSLEIILGAKTFEDFLDKVELVSYMSNSDKKMIDRLKDDIDVINMQKKALDEKKASLQTEQEKLSKRQTEMQKLVDENEKLLDGLYADNAGAQDHLDDANEERKQIEDQINAYYADKAAQEKAAQIAKEAQSRLNESRKAIEKANESANNSSKDTGTAVESSSKNESRQTSSSDTTTSRTASKPNTSSAAASEEERTQSYAVSSQEPESSSQPEPSSAIESSKPEPEPEPEPTPQQPSGYVWPVPGHYTLSSVWNEDRTTYNHGAIDISDGSIMNAEIVAAESGTVVLSNSDCTHNYGKDGSCGCGGGYGNYIMIDHGGGKATLYGHMTSLTVTSGDYVQKGQVIGYVGSTGWSTGPHLHFETRLNGEKYNPMTEYPNM